ncbi:MAG TPA: class I fructose-bisphosphate aldolase [Woeseiaceae bacterium]|jgi:fructose-bisphosphate aldolase class I|nr:class I fructose-bisphosphate aldolase [Woeseiaceae bacterium]
MNVNALNAVAKAMVGNGRGILAADESSPTIKKRFDTIAVESTEENRRRYREMLCTAPGIAEYIGGVILFDETIRQSTSVGVPFPKYLNDQGMVAGIKVDKGAKPLAAFPGELITEGLDGLRDRFKEYHAMGAHFAKWRAVINIGDGIPTDFCLEANAHALARYAALAQEAMLVPIVEPEVLMDGSHSIERCEEVTTKTLRLVFQALEAHRVELPGIVLKPNMVISGTDAPDRAGPQDVAEATLRVLKAQVPAEVPGIAFLSGGQSAEEATEHLAVMNRMGPLPWELSFSYGRALQAPSLQAWRGHEAQFKAGQDALFKRAKLNSLAHLGKYDTGMETAV